MLWCLLQGWLELTYTRLFPSVNQVTGGQGRNRVLIRDQEVLHKVLEPGTLR